MQNLRFAQTFMALLCPLTCILPSPMLILVYMITVWQYGCPDLILLSEQQTQISIYIYRFTLNLHISMIYRTSSRNNKICCRKKNGTSHRPVQIVHCSDPRVLLRIAFAAAMNAGQLESLPTNAMCFWHRRVLGDQDWKMYIQDPTGGVVIGIK